MGAEDETMCVHLLSFRECLGKWTMGAHQASSIVQTLARLRQSLVPKERPSTLEKHYFPQPNTGKGIFPLQ